MPKGINICSMRTGYYIAHPDQAADEQVPVPAPHKYSSYAYTATGDRKVMCSWCGQAQQ